MKLEPTDYWRLRALDADLQRSQMAITVAQQQAGAAQTKRQALWRELVEKYQLDPAANYRADDEDCSLTNGAEP